MIKSMTGFGRSDRVSDGRKISVEIKSINHRFLDISIRMPRRFNAMEADIRGILKKRIIRGKVDVFISYEDRKDEALALKYNRDIARAYVGYFNEIEKDFDLKSEGVLSAYALARFPDVITTGEPGVPDESVWEFLRGALEEALDNFDSAKKAEGLALKDDIEVKLNEMLEGIALAEQRYPEILKEYEEKLRARLDEVIESAQIEESRIAAELVIFADKLCTDEEIVRLRSHVVTMKQALNEGGEAGRRLDFISQEMNREANTLLSKAKDLRTSGIGIELKTTIEKIREQIQNVE